MITRKYIFELVVSISFLVIFVFSGIVKGGDGDNPTPTSSPPTTDITSAPSDQDHLLIVEELMTFDENCVLPCFWGFRIGEDSPEDTTNFVVNTFQQSPHISYADEREELIESEDAITNGIDFFETFIPLSSDGGSLQIIFGSVDNVLTRINIRLFMAANWLEENPYTLSQILETYGEPDTIYMRYSRAPTIGYVLVLIFEEQGFIVQYGFGNSLSSNERLTNERLTDQDRLLICDEDATYDTIELILQEDGNPLPLTELLQPPLNDETVFKPFWDIEDMTGLNVAQFTETFMGNSDACIEAYSLLELQELGYE